MSMGGSSQNTKSSASSQQASQSQSTASQWSNAVNQAASQSQSYVDPLQQLYLSGLYGSAAGFANPAATQLAAQQAAGATLPGLTTSFGNLAGLTDTTAQINAQTSSLKSGLADLFNKELMPTVRRDALTSGGFGGGRQGVAEALAAGEIADAFTSGLGDIYAGARSTAVSAASQLSGLASSIQSAKTLPTTAGLDALAKLASILGSPTVLSSSSSTSSGRSTSGGSSQSTSVSSGKSKSSSKGSASGWEFGIPTGS